jgi:hypothetical protein
LLLILQDGPVTILVLKNNIDVAEYNDSVWTFAEKEFTNAVLGEGGPTMRFILAPVLLFAAATCQGADDAPMASRVVDGMKLPFDPKGVGEGVKATLALLESCHSAAWPGPKPPTSDDVKKVLEGDHVRLVFAKPITARVMNEKVEFSQLVFGAGAFWLRSGDKVLRYTKYEHGKWKAFQEWYRQIAPAK